LICLAVNSARSIFVAASYSPRSPETWGRQGARTPLRSAASTASAARKLSAASSGPSAARRLTACTARAARKGHDRRPHTRALSVLAAATSLYGSGRPGVQMSSIKTYRPRRIQCTEYEQMGAPAHAAPLRAAPAPPTPAHAPAAPARWLHPGTAACPHRPAQSCLSHPSV